MKKCLLLGSIWLPRSKLIINNITKRREHIYYFWLECSVLQPPGPTASWEDISTSSKLRLRDGNGKVLIPWLLTSCNRMPGSSRSETSRRQERFCRKTVPTGNHSMACGNSTGLRIRMKDQRISFAPTMTCRNGMTSRCR